MVKAWWGFFFSSNMKINTHTPEAFWKNVKKVVSKEKAPAANAAQPASDSQPSPTAEQPSPKEVKSPSPDHSNKNTMEKSCVNVKTIVKSVTVANGSVAGNYTTILSFGNEFKNIVGYYIIPASLGGITAAQIKVGLSDSTKTIQDPTCLEHFQVSTAVPIKDRFYKEDPIEISGGNITVGVTTAATLSSTLELQFVAQVIKE